MQGRCVRYPASLSTSTIDVASKQRHSNNRLLCNTEQIGQPHTSLLVSTYTFQKIVFSAISAFAPPYNFQRRPDKRRLTPYYSLSRFHVGICLSPFLHYYEQRS